MRTIFASSLALAAMTSIALADAPLATDSRSDEPIRLTNGQMDQVKAAGQNQNNNNDCLTLCNNNNQQTQSGSNTGGDFIGTGDLNVGVDAL